MAEQDQAFWRRKGLAEMTAGEWESLCDGCARCCLIKLEDEESGELYHTKLACHLLDIGSCRCGDYANRHARVPDCIHLTPANAGTLDWLPKSCAYRLVAEGKELHWWHPLVSGDRATVREAGISVSGYARSERGIPVEKMDRFVIRDPAAPRRR